MNNTEAFKKYFWMFLNLLLVVLIILGIFSVSAIRRYIDTSPAVRTITISAEGKTVVSPDIAKINFSVISEGMDTVKISSENTEKMNKAIEFIKKEGIDSKDIQTAGYTLSPKYEYDEARRKSYISGYTLTQTVYLKIRDFSKISKILGALPELGANNISSLSFEIENQDEALAEAREQAFEKAYDKAKEMAKQNRVRLKRVINFSEYQNYYPMYATKEAYGLGGADQSLPSAPTPTIEPGSQEVKVSVNVTYEIN